MSYGRYTPPPCYTAPNANSPLLPNERLSSPPASSNGIIRVIKWCFVVLVLGLVLFSWSREQTIRAHQDAVSKREQAVLIQERAVARREEVVLHKEGSLFTLEVQLRQKEHAVRDSEDAVARRENAVYAQEREVSRREQAISVRERSVVYREDTVRAREEAMRADDERRIRAHLIWTDPVAEQRCLSYEKRMYHAELQNVPEGENAQKWCMQTSINIHGIAYDHPDSCTMVQADGGMKVIGHWTVTGNEPTCRTWWGNHEKKECFGSHQRRVEAHLYNHQQPWDNWSEMCFSTPSDFAWQSFAHPDTCENAGTGGIIGSWFINVDTKECP
ncbi:uncharacterized protein FIBRA_05064 [Fibroporia radiculosa]|uniref:Uncharacterized protein n=1 Tax=Fibroporia radiculosa TaxID=599839 RepID=J4H3A8_9APHY|nr:uncharacterized protein FIBRA_05064 [Fibroporia radiculosa]CCM02949.1 predicted protein [Fibroporia radiculosa]